MKSSLFKLCRKKNYWAPKFWKIACLKKIILSKKCYTNSNFFSLSALQDINYFILVADKEQI
jgi:hypothetical protein